MIEQTGGLGSTIQNERLYRDNAVTETGRQQPPPESEATDESRVSDTVTLSAEAVALARNLVPAAAAGEAQEPPASTAPADDAPAQRPGSIDILV